MSKAIARWHRIIPVHGVVSAHDRGRIREIILDRSAGLTWPKIAEKWGMNRHALYLMRTTPGPIFDAWHEIEGEVVEDLRSRIGPRLWERMMELLESGDHKAAVNAGRVLLDRLYGRATQQVEVNVTAVNPLSGMSVEQLEMLARGGSLPALPRVTSCEVSNGEGDGEGED